MNNQICAKEYEFVSESSVRTVRENCSVLTESAVLLKDLREEKYYVRCVFCNLADEPLRDLFVDVVLKKNGTEIGCIEDFHYEVRGIERDMEFGQTLGIPIDIPKDFDVAEILTKKAIFLGGREEIAIGESLSLPEKIKLTEYLGDTELAIEYMSETKSEGGLVPKEIGSYWLCSCGYINHNDEEKCRLCGAEKEMLFSKLNLQLLQENIARREAEEAEQKALKRKKIKKVAIITVLLFLLAVGAYVFVDKGLPIIRYNSAEQAFDNGDYEKAYTVFTKLEGYKDSSARSTEAYYRYGLACIDNKEYTTAMQVFEELENYQESRENLKEAKYLNAGSLLEAQQYVEAVDAFKEMKDYKKSDSKILEAMYGYVINHKNSKDKTTYAYIQELKKASYRDSSKIYKKLYAWKAKLVINNNDKDANESKKTISKYDKIYCHVILEGGEPNAKTKLKYSAKYPNGSVASGAWDKEWKEGTDGQCSFWYDIPEYGKTGTFSVSVYDTKSGAEIGKSTVELVN